MYPQDELSRIKMRNRRFMNACAMEMGMGGGAPPMMGGPMMGMMPQQMPPQMMMMGPAPTLDAEMATDELSVSVHGVKVQTRGKYYVLCIWNHK